jgi:hypothetical protein
MLCSACSHAKSVENIEGENECNTHWDIKRPIYNLYKSNEYVQSAELAQREMVVAVRINKAWSHVTHHGTSDRLWSKPIAGRRIEGKYDVIQKRVTRICNVQVQGIKTIA